MDGQFLRCRTALEQNCSDWAQRRLRTIAQAYFKTTNPIGSIPTANADGTMNTFDRSGVSPIAGLWAMP